MAFFCFITFCN